MYPSLAVWLFSRQTITSLELDPPCIREYGSFKTAPLTDLINSFGIS